MKKLIILTGDLATGKTSFSRKLADRYGTQCFNKDYIKEKLADTIGFANREENLKLSKASIAIMTHIFEEGAKGKGDLILEANFHKDEISTLYEIAEKNNVQVLTLLFEADLKVLYDRFKYRIEHENRHPVHQSAGLKTYEAFEKYILNSRNDVILPDCLRVDASSFEYQTDEALLSKIDEFMK